jgi:acyl-CoA thioester hydrolase
MPKSEVRHAGNGVHVFPIRVYYEDTDAAGIVYYANYLRFAERARTEMLRSLGVGHARMMEADGLAFAVRRCSVEFVKPAKLDDLLEVETRVVDVGGASIVAEQRVRRATTELVRLEMTLACVSLAGRPARMPAGLRSRLAGLQATEH